MASLWLMIVLPWPLLSPAVRMSTDEKRKGTEDSPLLIWPQRLLVCRSWPGVPSLHLFVLPASSSKFRVIQESHSFDGSSYVNMYHDVCMYVRTSYNFPTKRFARPTKKKRVRELFFVVSRCIESRFHSLREGNVMMNINI